MDPNFLIYVENLIIHINICGLIVRKTFKWISNCFQNYGNLLSSESARFQFQYWPIVIDNKMFHFIKKIMKKNHAKKVKVLNFEIENSHVQEM